MFSSRGYALERIGDWDRAIRDFSETIKLDPNDALAYSHRGTIWSRKHEVASAIDDLTEAIKLDPKSSCSYYNRGVIWNQQGDFSNALHDYSEAVRLDPKNYVVYRNIAWLKATCSEDRYRDGKQALEYATKACELSGWKSPMALSALAAAYAEMGDFTNAIKWREKTIELVEADQKHGVDEPLELYRAGKPYREILKNTD